MIRHVVCFRMKEGCSAGEAKEMLLSMRGREETALSVEVGVDALHSPRSYDLILIVTLEDFARALSDAGLSRAHRQALYALRDGGIGLRGL